MSVFIVLPVYHEENSIRRVVRGIEKHVITPHTTVLVFQDRHDQTVPIAKKLQKSFSNLEIIFTKNKTGMLPALLTGFSHAPRSAVIVITMADLSDDPRDIEKMIRKLDSGYDLVCGSRYCSGGRHLGGPLIKGFLSRFACLTLRFFTGIPTHDATNAFKCFRKSLLRHIKIESEEGFALPLELVVKAYALGYRIGEIPTTWKDREAGTSKFQIWRNLRFYLQWYFFGFRAGLERFFSLQKNRK